MAGLLLSVLMLIDSCGRRAAGAQWQMALSKKCG